MIARSYALALVPVLVAALAAGCTGDDPTPASPTQDAGGGGDVVAPPPPPGDGGTTEDGGTLATLAIDPPIVRILQDKTANATVTLTRNGFAGDVNVTIDGLPTGVTASVPPIAAGTTTAQVTFTSTATATLGVGTFTMKAAGVADGTGTIAVAGAPGSLDTTFDQDGLRLDGTISSTGVFYAVAVQPDGKVVAAGSPNTSGGGWTVRRYEADGSPDMTFNTNAAAVVPTSGAARGIAFDPMKGRVVVVGSYNGFNSTAERLAIVRLNADGTADQAFGSGGSVLVTSVIDSQGSRGSSVIVNPDSSILVAGMKNWNPGANEASMQKYDATGQLVETGFTNYVSPAQPRTFTGIFPLAQGTFIATGTDGTTSPNSQQAVRFEAKGTPDSTFGIMSGGFKSYAKNCNGNGAALMKGGDVVIVGSDITGPGFCETRIAASTDGNMVWNKTIGIGNAANFFGVTAGGMTTTADTSYAVGHGGGTYDKYGRIVHRDAAGNGDSAWGTSGILDFQDPQSPDMYGFQFFAATSTPEGRLTVAGTRTGQGAGFMIMRIWE